MAITITKDLLPINPAYNDSIIQFSSSTFSAATRAEVVVNGETFNVVPFSGKFTFNFKEIVEVLINTNKFEDTVEPELSTGAYLHSDSSIRKSISVTLRVIGNGTNDVVNKTYVFIRSVEQLLNYHNAVANMPTTNVFLPTKNYVDYYAPYFEGYPFDFALTVPVLTTFQFRNITTGQQTSTYTNLTSNVRRIFLSDGAFSTTELDILSLSSTLNKIEFWVGGVFRANIYIKKYESDCGVQIKWLNSKGSYSYWKFDRTFKSTITPKTIDDFQGRYDNLQNLTASSYIIGKTASQTLSVTSNYTSEDATYLADLIYSPAVWMNINYEPFQQQQPFTYIGVKLNDSGFGLIDTKTNKGKLNLTITLPEINTIKQ